MIRRFDVTVSGHYPSQSDRDYCDDGEFVDAEVACDLANALENLMSANGGGRKECGHDFDCVCANDKAKLALANFKGKNDE